MFHLQFLPELKIHKKFIKMCTTWKHGLGKKQYKANKLVMSFSVKSLYSRFQEIDRLHIGAGIFNSFRFLQ